MGKTTIFRFSGKDKNGIFLILTFCINHYSEYFVLLLPCYLVYSEFRISVVVTKFNSNDAVSNRETQKT